MVAFLLGAVSAGAWIYLLLFRGRFWDVRVPAAAERSGAPASIVAIIPARDEASGIGRAVDALLRQQFAGDLRLVVVDDHSTDGTARVAREAAERLGAAERLNVIAAGPLPPGWTGKLWALSEGVRHAETVPADYLLLTDADIVHAPSNLGTLVDRARHGDLDLVSQMVLLRCVSWPERALIPAFVFFFFMLYPPRWAADPASRTAAAAGGCILIRPEALRRIGGIAAIRHALIDDCALAAAVKRTGGRSRLDVTHDAWSIREYGTAREIWSMIARTAFTQLGYSTVLLVGTIAGLAITYLAPPVLLLFAHGWARVLGGATWLAMAAAFWPTVRHYRLNPVWTLALPVIAVFYAAATIGSAVAFWQGSGGIWKGRAQAPLQR